MKKKDIGSSFDDWLREERIYEDTTAVAIKRVLARQISQEMIDRKLTKSDMARRMNTSRAALDRLLDPENEALYGRATLARYARNDAGMLLKQVEEGNNARALAKKALDLALKLEPENDSAKALLKEWDAGRKN